MNEFGVLVGEEVEQIWVWWSLRLVFELEPPGGMATHVDMTEFRFEDGRGQSHAVNVESDPLSAGPVLGLLHRRVTEASVDDWTIRLVFDNGASVVCQPHERFEAWAASLAALGTSGSFFCPIGGGSGSPT